MIRKTATLALATLAAAATLAACGPTNDEAAPADTGKATEATENTSDGGTAAEAVDDANDPAAAEDATGAAPDAFTLPGIGISDENGGVYTLGAPESLAPEDAQLLRDAGWEEGKVNATKVMPVEIDNTQSDVSTSVDGLTTVDTDGNTLEYSTLASFFPTVADDEGVIDRDSDTYYAMWDAHPYEEDEVAPTARSTVYIVVPHNWDVSGEFTYAALTVDMMDELPLYPDNIGVDE